MANLPAGKKRWLLGCGCLVLGGLLLLALAIVIGVWGANAALDRAPTTSLPDLADPAALMSASQKVQTAVMAGMLDADSHARDGAGQASLQLALATDEINALLQSGIAIQQGMALTEQGPDAERVNCRFQDGRFTVEFSKRLDRDTPFGNWINITAQLIPEISDGHLRLTLVNCRLGKLSTPTREIQRRLDEQEIPRFANSPQGQMVLRLVERLEVKPDGIVLHYRPDALNKSLSGIGISGGIFDLLESIGEME